MRRPPGHRLVVRLQAVLAGGGLAAVIAAIAVAAGSVQRQSSVHDFAIGGHRFTYPSLNLAAVALLLLGGVSASAIAIAARAGWTQVRAQRRFLAQIPIVGCLTQYPRASVIRAPEPQAFCSGWLRPRIYISTGALEVLESEELRAVLEHEHHHVRVRDPLRLAWTRITAQALFFLPALRALGRRYGDIAELEADEAAVGASTGDKAPLASALLAFDANSPPGTAGVSPERVDSLLGAPLPWKPPMSTIVASLLALLAMTGVLWSAGAAASARASFNLPFLSSQPCIAIVGLLSLLVCAAALRRRRRVPAFG